MAEILFKLVQCKVTSAEMCQASYVAAGTLLIELGGAMYSLRTSLVNRPKNALSTIGQDISCTLFGIGTTEGSYMKENEEDLELLKAAVYL